MESRVIKIDQNCLNEFKRIQQKNNSVELIFLKLNENFDILYVEKTLSSKTSHDDFLESIPVDEPRLIIYKKLSNTIFIRWIPEIVKDTIEYSYSNASTAILEILNGIDIYIEAKDLIQLSNL
ncbi:hypothetical protein ACTFIV_003162 [Dictyostelium citrinum]